MSAVGEARQRRAGVLRAASWPARILHWALRVALVLVVLLVVGAGLLAWRLAEGPLDVGWLARRIEGAAFPADSPTRLAIGRATVAWNGFREGADGGLEVRLRNVEVVNRSGAPGAALQEADVTVSVAKLLELQVAPRFIGLTGLRLSAVRAEDGTVTLDLGALNGGDDNGQGPGLQDVLGELRRPAGTDRGGALAQLRGIRVHDARVLLEDRQLGATVQAEVDDLDLARQGGGGVKGGATGRLGLGDAMASVQLAADLLAGGGTHLDARVLPLQTSTLARSDPALASLGALDAALQARASLDLSPALEPRSGSLHASTAGGTFSLRGGTVTFERLQMDADGTWSGSSWRPDRIDVGRMQAVLPAPGGGWSTTVSATGAVTRAGGTVGGRFDISLDHLRFGDLPTLWPAAWGGNVRPWLAENVTAGTARDGAVTLTLSAPEANPADVTLTGASGTLGADDVTINWLRPVPPIEHAQANLRVVGPDVIEISVPTAVQGPIAVRDGLIRFTGLTAKDQLMALTLSVQGQVPDVIQLLKHPRLRLLDKHPLPIKSSSGAFSGKLSVDMPMKKDLDFDMVRIGAQVRTKDMRLAGLVAGRDLDHADAQIDITSDGLKAQGPAAVANVAGTIGVEMDFRAGPPTQVLERASMTGKATPKQFAGAGVDTGGVITAGQAGVSVTYTALRNGSAQVAAKADLTEAGVALLGWRKAPGPPADAAATVLLQDDKLAGISGIAAHGPGLELQAEAEMVGSRPLLLRLQPVVIGPTQASGEVRFPERTGEPIRARLSGPQIDLSRELSSSETGGKAGGDAGESGSPWIADIQFERVILSKRGALSAVRAHAEDDGRRIRVLDATSSGPEAVQAHMAPSGLGRRLTVRAADGGALLRALDILDSIHGGALALDAQYDDRYADPPLAGTLDLSSFGVRDAVAVGKLLQAVTIYGIMDAMRGEGVQFSRLLMPFRYGGDVLTIGEARAYSPSLGVTARGTIDLGRKAINLRGTVVPAYAVNTALGRIPLLGRLFSPERGGGLLAVNYSVSGRLSDPSVTVNPLSALTPGFLRGLFSVFR